jgi:hypothetical protein
MLDMPPIGINKVGGRGRPKSSIKTRWRLEAPTVDSPLPW